MMKVGMNMFVKTLALPFLVAPIFVSCMVDDPEDKFDFSSDGQPIANYQIMGKVSDEDGKPINGIRVIADYSTDVIYRADTLYTDQEGEYSKFKSIPRVDKFYMSFTDIDGQANGGEFGPKSEYVTPVRTEISSGHFGGSYVISFNATLKKK